ncbi:unnamed protein product [Prorocentrum cordatum]|uniref:Uncharacterized protein n=1 Tax=Prorocentrum cordatum TaxID=2364126 RepID=A0ABN9PZA4_9DINO|nr:unnamed protein product [Polarella glacialis]
MRRAPACSREAFVNGMADVAAVVAALLDRRQVPAARELAQLLSPTASPALGSLGLRVRRHALSHFFGKGGRVDHVLDAVIDEAASLYEALDAVGDAAGALGEGDEEPAGLGGRLCGFHRLPVHVLDGDFDRVRSALTRDGQSGAP